MLGFIPMIDEAIVYKKDIENADMWGIPQYTETYRGSCQLTYKTDLADVYAYDGKSENNSVTILFKGEVKVAVGDKIGFIHNGAEITEIVTGVHFMRDWGGKVFSTRVVSGAAKRDY